MKRKHYLICCPAYLAALLLVVVFSCRKKAEIPDNPGLQTNTIELTAASTIAENLYDDVFNQINIEAVNNNVAERLSTTTGIQGCAVVTLSPADLTTFPKTMTLDFGSGCSLEPVLRKGKLIVTLNGRLRNAGTTLSVSFENYFVNDYKLEGAFNLINNTTNNVLSFTSQTSNGKLTYPGGLVSYTHSGTHTYTQIGGSNTPSYFDDSWSVTGIGTTTSPIESLAWDITTPLIKSIACGSIVSGVTEFKYNNNTSGTLNFGDGTCDRLATLNIGAYNSVISF